MVELSFEQNIEQALQLHLSPKMLAMLRVLQLSYCDMVAEVEKASEENPFVELEKPEALTEYLRYLESDRKAAKKLDKNEYPGIDTLKDVSRDLQSHLTEQLRLVELTEEEVKIGEYLLSFIDGRGYLNDYEKAKAEIAEKFKADAAVADKLLEVVQSFEPEGVGARDLKECLLIQLREMQFDNFELEELIGQIISDHLEDLGNREFKKIAEAVGITEAGVIEVAEFVRSNLNPHPAASFSGEERHVIPSFVVDKGQLVNLEERYGPKIKLSAEYQRMLKDKKTDAETVSFLKSKLTAAKDLMENLEKRGATISRIMQMIYEDQKNFFDKGASHLRPLPQKEIAARLGVHPSTISRAIAEKYIQTPKGMMPIKFLCSREVSGFSPAQIKKMISDLVAAEKKAEPMTDDDIKRELLERGARIERRTVASYRKELGIPSYSERAAS
ncbi:MAG TPA: RNA polymerase factor sigma-54 [Candidatus Omnitrophota bacterium]|nr:RNA polymerase factor sigma-54 [Candidatus Omnitrophota bacterium]